MQVSRGPPGAVLDRQPVPLLLCKTSYREADRGMGSEHGSLMREFADWFVAAGFTLALIHSLWTGSWGVRGVKRPFTRKDHPTEFWVGMSALAVFILMLIWIGLQP